MKAFRLLRFAAKRIDATEADILLAHTISQSRVFLLAHPDTTVSLWQTIKFLRAVKKREQHWPVAYLIGHKEFFGRDFIVSPATLIPRPDSECLIESIKNEVGHGAPLIFDIGTGSGALAITLAAEIPSAQVFASDVSRDALKIAKQNAAKNEVRIEFERGSLLTPYEKTIRHATEPVCIVANLPYLTPTEIKTESSLVHEPVLALDGGDDGLHLYRTLWSQIHQLRAQIKNHVPWHVWCEINPEQLPTLSSLVTNLFPTARLNTLNDLGGLARALYVVLNEQPDTRTN